MISYATASSTAPRRSRWRDGPWSVGPRHLAERGTARRNRCPVAHDGFVAGDVMVAGECGGELMVKANLMVKHGQELMVQEWWIHGSIWWISGSRMVNHRRSMVNHGQEQSNKRMADSLIMDTDCYGFITTIAGSTVVIAGQEVLVNKKDWIAIQNKNCWLTRRMIVP